MGRQSKFEYDGGTEMKGKGKWAILIAMTIIVSLVIVGTPVAACFGQTTSCEGDSVYQGDGGATDYWYDDLYPPNHEIVAGGSYEWTINVRIVGSCSAYEHLTVTDDEPPTDWSTSIKMGTIYSGSFTYVLGGGTVYEGDYIENQEIYLGRSCEFDIIYNITAPPDAVGGKSADQICTVYVVGYNPENQHDYVYVHCLAKIAGMKPPIVTVTSPTYAETLSGSETIMWNAFTTSPGPTWSFDIYLSPDFGVTYPYTLVSGYTPGTPGPSFSWSWDTTPHPDHNLYRLKIEGFDSYEYGFGISDNFTLENHAPDPPPELVIHFGLTTNAEPTAKAVEDNTGSDLERLDEDDKRAYTVPKGKIMSLETFNTAIQADPVESATLYVKYWINMTGYTGNQYVLWKLETDVAFMSTGIQPLPSELTATVKTFDLFANGVDTIDEIANLDIYFQNNDGGSWGPQGVMFDCLWITVKASSNDLGLTWLPSTALDIEHYNVYKSINNVDFILAGQPTITLWRDPGTAGDLSNYFYFVRSVDLGGSQGLPTSTVAKYVTSFSGGWNLGSIPLIQQGDSTISDVMQSVDSSIYDNFWSYHADNSRPWLHWYSKQPSMFNSLSDMDHVRGYYMEMEASGNLITLGIVPKNTVINIKAGWNLIGYPNIVDPPQTVNEALSTIAGSYNKVLRFDTTTGAEVQMTGLDIMYPGQGYWIYALNNCELIL
jgi:hypothetical protein